MKKIIYFSIILLCLIGIGRGIKTAGEGKSNSRIIHSMTFGLFGMSEESELVRAGGVEMYTYIEFQKNLKRYKEKCVGQRTILKECDEFLKKLEPNLKK
jgi:hypothetical protein